MKNGRPDVIIVMTDQHRADVCAREGFPLDTTPFLDSLAREGTWFDKAYTTSPLCCPARTSLMTGRFASAHRVTQNPAAGRAVFDDDLFGVARAAGYATALIGKNHTYLRPENADFFSDYQHGGRAGGSKDPVEAEFESWLSGLRHRTAGEATDFPVEVQNPYRIVDETLSWVGSVPEDQPLLAVVSFPEPHNPYQVPEPYFSMFPPESLPPVHAGADTLEGLPFAWRYLRRLGESAYDDYAQAIDRARASYFGMLRLIDDQVRRLHDGLESRHASRERVIAMTADHGDYVGEYGLVRKGAEISDILARIPLLVNGDQVTARPDAHDAHVSLADLMPTLCEAIGWPLPPGVQGRSLWPLLTGQSYPAAEFGSVYVEQGFGGLPYEQDDVPSPMPGLFTDGPGGAARFDELNAVTQGGRRRMVRSGDWTLHAGITGDFRLHDLRSDPLELVNRWADPSAAEARTELLARLAVWQMRAEDPLPVVPGGYQGKRDPRNYLAPYARPAITSGASSS
ncbi:sulfatase-like hydrolase/transferase [Nonomuraea insulae]|uniref:Sulfatase-like hydrolase/transferase n=1 Tax=Nonomuraea insulae TaxID=1616787 RepID=A0ABW1DG25_9ACTN